MKISVVLVTCNEADLLDACLSRLGFEDELVVLDMQSTDGSAAIAERYGARVVTIERAPYVERVRNIGLDEANGDWILFLDADELVPPGFGAELRAELKDSDASAYRLTFRTIGFGRTLYHGDVQEVLPKRRLLRRSDLAAESRWPSKLCLVRGGTSRWPDNPHPHTEPEVDGPIRRWEGVPIDHHCFRSVSQQLEKQIRYIENRRPGPYRGRPLGPWMPLRTFYRHLVVQRWWRDGTVGIEMALMYTMKDWMLALQDWEWRGHPEERIGAGARTVLTTAEVVHGANDRLRRLWEAATRRLRRVVSTS